MAVKKTTKRNVLTLRKAKQLLKTAQIAIEEQKQQTANSEAEVQRLLSGAQQLNAELKQVRQQNLNEHNMGTDARRDAMHLASVNKELYAAKAEHESNTFNVTVSVSRGKMLSQSSTFVFEKGAHSLQLVVDSGGSVRNVVGDIGDMRDTIGIEPLHIHRQEPLSESVEHERVGDIASTRIHREWSQQAPGHGAGAGAPNGRGGPLI